MLLNTCLCGSLADDALEVPADSELFTSLRKLDQMSSLDFFSVSTHNIFCFDSFSFLLVNFLLDTLN